MIVADVALPRESHGVLTRVAGKVANIVASTAVAEAICQVVRDTRASRLRGLESIGVEPCDDLIGGGGAALLAAAQMALEESWREAICHTLKDICVLNYLAETSIIAVTRLHLGK